MTPFAVIAAELGREQHHGVLGEPNLHSMGGKMRVPRGEGMGNPVGVVACDGGFHTSGIRDKDGERDRVGERSLSWSEQRRASRPLTAFKSMKGTR